MANVTPKGFSPYADLKMALGRAAKRWSTIFAKEISDGEKVVAVSDLAAVLSVGTRRQLTTNTIYYVRAEGSDDNDGLAETTAFATIDRAVAELLRIDGNGYQVTISIGPGTWALSAPITLAQGHTVGLSRLTVTGTPASPAILTSSSAITLLYVTNTIAPVFVSYIRFEGGTYHIRSDSAGGCYIGNVTFGAASSGHIYTIGGSITINGNYVIDGAAGSGHIIVDGGRLTFSNRTVTITANHSLSSFIATRRGAYARTTGNTFTGVCSGRRFVIGPQSTIEAGTADANYFPGTTEGTISEYGGYYF